MNRCHVARLSIREGDWRFKGYENSIIELKNLVPLLNGKRLENLKLIDIAWKGKNLFPQESGIDCYCCGGKKYRSCDTKYPLIVAKNARNPFNNKYRMIDGRHRIQKLLLNGYTFGLCYVFDISELRPYIEKK